MRESRIQIPGLELLGELGRGANGVVYQARREGRLYAVKVPLEELADSRTERLAQRFVREAIALARVRHPALPDVLEVGQVEGLPYIVMELIPGQTLKDRLRNSPLRVDQVVDLGRQLAGALEAIHRSGLVHRDVKPRNIVFDAHTTAARLVDFGFAVSDDLPPRDTAGTPGYIAPEAREPFERVDGRADLYSLGCVLFESLTGAPPAEDTDIRAAASLAASADDSTNSAQRRLAVTLVDIIARLLAFRPDDRYQSAGTLEAALSDLGNDQVAPRPRVPFDREQPGGSPLVGRREELNLLKSAWAETRDHRAAAVVVTGGAGSGKTRLVRELAAEVSAEGYQLLSAHSEESDRGTFAAIRRLVAGYIEDCDERPEDDRIRAIAELRSLAGDMAPLLKILSPSLARIFDDAPTLPRFEDTENVLAEGLSGFLVSLLAELAPCLVIIDNLQWMDRSSRLVMQRLLDRIHETRSLFVLVVRQDSGIAVERLFNSLMSKAAQIRLGPLPDAELGQLVMNYLGQPKATVDVVRYTLGLSDGSPLSALQVVRAMLESGGLVPHWGQWRLDQRTIAEMSLPRTSLGILARRIAALDEPTRDLLRTAAVIGVVFEDTLLMDACPMVNGNAHSALDEARRMSLTESAPRGRHRFVHDAVREALLAELDDREIRKLHYRLAQALEARIEPWPVAGARVEIELVGVSDSPSATHGPFVSECDEHERPFQEAEGWYRLATHYALAGVEEHAERVLATSGRAAELAFRGFFSEQAVTFFQFAEQAATVLSRNLAPRQQLLFAESLLRLGRLSESLTRFSLVTEGKSQPLLRALAFSGIAWVQMQLDTEESWGAVRSAFRELGETPPGETISGVLKSIIGQAGRFGMAKAANLSPAERRRLELLCDLYYQTGRLGIVRAKPLTTIQATVRSLRPAERLGQSSALAKSYLMYSFVLTALGRREAGRKYLERADRVTVETKDPAVSAHALQVRTAVAAWAGDMDAALRASSRVLSELGHWRELGEYCLLTYTHQQIEGLRGRHCEAWRWIEAAVRRVNRHEGTPLALDYLEVAACAALTSLGREKEAAAILGRLRDGLAVAPEKRVVIVSTWGPKLRIFTERGDLGDGFEKLVTDFRERGYNPRRVHLEVTEFYVHVAHAFVHACVRANSTERGALLPRLKGALDDLEKAARIPLLRAHRVVIEAYVAWFSGKRATADKLFARAELLAGRETVPWVLYAVHRGRAHMLLEQGRADAARDQAKMAEAVAAEHGAAYRLAWIREEFALRGVGTQAAAASSRSSGRSDRADSRSGSSASSRARAQGYLGALLRITQARARELAPDRQARLVLDEVVHALHADRGFLFLLSSLDGLKRDSSASSSLELAAARDEAGIDVLETGDLDRKLIDEAFLLGATELGLGATPARSTSRGQSAIAAPLVVRDAPIGVVCVQRRNARHPFDEDDGQILFALAAQVPVALELARSLYERDLAQEALQKTERLEAVSRMAGGIAHDFNNMLSVILGSARTLRASAANAEVVESAEAIVSATERARELTRQLLTFARGQYVKPEVLSLNACVERLAPAFERLLGQRIELELRLDPELGNVKADSAQIDQVITNLVMNAGDAMPEGGRIVIQTRNAAADHEHVRRFPRVKPGAYTLISVTDSGEGMDEQTLSRLFEPFFTTKGAKGTGLGLATAYGIVQQSGGHIDVRSELGVGTAFHIYLPLAHGPLSEPPPEPKPVEARPAQGTILLIDDEPLVRAATSRVLRTLGYRVIQTGDSDSAMREAFNGTNRIDLVITDVIMPGMNGLELARELTKMRPGIRVLFMSGYTDGVLAERGILQDQVHFIQKPIEPKELARRVSEVLSSDVHALD